MEGTQGITSVVSSMLRGVDRQALVAAERARREARRAERDARRSEAVADVLRQGEDAQRKRLNTDLAARLTALLERRTQERRVADATRAVAHELNQHVELRALAADWPTATWDRLRQRLEEQPAAVTLSVVDVLDRYEWIRLPSSCRSEVAAALSDDIAVGAPLSLRVWHHLRHVGSGLEMTRAAASDLARCGDVALLDLALGSYPEIARDVRMAAFAPADVAYVGARTAPATLSRDAVVRLGWLEELRRRALIAGEPVDGDPDDSLVLRQRLLDGDLSACELAAAVVPELAESLRGILASAGDSSGLAAYVSDYSLWPLLASAHGSARPATGDRAFDGWCSLTLAKAALYAEGPASAAKYLGGARSNAATDLYRAESLALSLYCAVVGGDALSAKSFQAKLEQLRAGLVTDRNLEAGRRALRYLADGDHRAAIERFESPFVLLGIDEGRDVESRWRELLRRHRTDIDRRAEINRAKASISTSQGVARHFSVPMQEKAYSVRRTGSLIPDATPIAPVHHGDLALLREARYALALDEIRDRALLRASEGPLWKALAP